MIEQFRHIDWEKFHFLRIEHLIVLCVGIVLLTFGFFFYRESNDWKKSIAKHLQPYVIQKGTAWKSRLIKLTVILMFILGGMQGVLGWYMVKSGLVDIPRVSQYRLTAHLVAAFTIYAYMFWVALSLCYPATPGQRHAWFGKALALTTLTSVTIFSGGFVAGLRAGKIYNTFPMMGDSWVPPGLMALDPFWRNFFDNMVTVQFNHRVLAITTLIAIVVFWIKSRSAPIPPRTRLAVNALLATGLLQVTLGITTLLMSVPIVLGAAHQGVALLLFTVTLYVLHTLRRA